MKQWLLPKNLTRLCWTVILLCSIGFPTEGAQSTDTANSIPVNQAEGKADLHKGVNKESDPQGRAPVLENGQSETTQTGSQSAEDILSNSEGSAEMVTGETRRNRSSGERNRVRPRAEPSDVNDPLPVVEEIDTEYVRSLTQITVGHNDSNPLWSPSGELIAFERSIGDKREIIIANPKGDTVQKIYFRANDGDEEMAFLFPGVMEEISYNSGITWSPDEKSLVFMSNAGSGNYDLYLWPELGKQGTVRLTENEEKDSHPHWSPQNNQLVFVSGRTGKADIFVMDLQTQKATQLTNGHKTYLYPQWSPNGQKIAMIYGSNENHDIYVIGDITQPTTTLTPLTTWAFDDLRPVWSPDGTKVAFYSNYNREDDQKLWSLVVVAADGSDPTEGDGLVAKIVATNVIPDIERGPAWMMDSNRIVFVKNDEQAFNPLYLVNVSDGSMYLIKTETKMNHDVICSTTGTLAFRAQVEQWDHIYIAKLKQ